MRTVVVGLLAATMVVLCGCPGGSGGGSGSGTPVATPISITGGTLTCNPLTLMSGQTSTCTAVLTGTGNFNPSVTWTASAGTIINGGMTAVFTAPVVASSTAVTVTATSVQDTSKSLTVTITVGPRVPTIAGIVANTNGDPVLYLDGPAGVGVLVNGTNFAQGDTLSVTPSFFGGPYTLGQGISPTQISLPLNIGSAEYSPGLICVTVTTSQGLSSNASCIAFVGNQNVLAVGPTGEFYLFDQGQGMSPTSSNGFVRKFKADGTSDGSFWVGGLMNGIAVDDKTGYVVINGGTYDPTSGQGVASPANDGNSAAGAAMADAAKSGQGCIARPMGNIISCYAVGQNGAPLYSVAVGVQPWVFTMIQTAPELDTIVYSRGDTKLWKVSVPDMTVRGSVALTGIAPVTSFGSVGGWQLAAGSLGKTVVFLAQADEQLVFVDIGTMSVTKQVNLKTLLGTGYVHPIRVALDEPHGKALVAVADTNAGLTRFVSIDATSGAMTTIVAASTLLSVGFGVSADGTTLYSCQRAACEAWPTSAVQPKATASAVTAHARTVAPSAVFSLGGGIGTAAGATNLVPEIAFSVSRTEVKPGRAVFLSWSAKDVASCFAFGDWQGPRPAKGAETVLPSEEGIRNYFLACTGEDGDVMKSATVTVRENPVIEPPTLEVSAPAKVRVGESAAIRWATTNADSCSAGDLGDQPTNGSAFVASPIPGTFTRALTCKGPGGVVSRTVTLTVGLPGIFDLF